MKLLLHHKLHCIPLVLAGVAVFLFIPLMVSAFIGIPFGGMVAMTIPCTCSIGTLVVVGPPVGGTFMLMPWSIIHPNGMVLPGHWVLGQANGASVCLVGAPPFCVPAGGGPVILNVGTS